jgi:hypothetical protein
MTIEIRDDIGGFTTFMHVKYRTFPESNIAMSYSICSVDPSHPNLSLPLCWKERCRSYQEVGNPEVTVIIKDRGGGTEC